jgi:hypothetical protein
MRKRTLRLYRLLVRLLWAALCVILIFACRLDTPSLNCMLKTVRGDKVERRGRGRGRLHRHNMLQTERASVAIFGLTINAYAWCGHQRLLHSTNATMSIKSMGGIEVEEVAFGFQDVAVMLFASV